MKTPANLTRHNEQGSAFFGKVLSILLAGCIVSLLLISNASAQQPGALPEVTITGTTMKVNERALKSFQRTFKEAESPRWFMIEKRFLVKHISNDMRHNTLYGRRGAFIYDIGYGVGKDLPEMLRSQVNDSYKNYAVTTAINVRQAGRTIWKINVEDDKNIITLHAQDGLITEQERIDKSSPASVTAFRLQEQSVESLLSEIE